MLRGLAENSLDVLEMGNGCNHIQNHNLAEEADADGYNYWIHLHRWMNG